jgi:hypothetical protein
MRRHHVPIVLLGIATCAGAACGIRSRLERGAHDVPVPPGEARSEIAVVVDLEPRVACDEAFSVQMYRHAGVELVTWDAQHRTCRGRRVVVKYLPRRVGRAALLERIERLSLSSKVE